MLVKVWGKVTYASPSAPYYFTIDDGSGMADQFGNPGVGVYCGNVMPPSMNAYVKVTGISSLVSGFPVVLIRQTGDWQ